MLLQLDVNEALKKEYWGRMNAWFKSHIEFEEKESKSAISILLMYSGMTGKWNVENTLNRLTQKSVKLLFNEFIKSEFINHFEDHKSGRLFFSYLNLQEYIEIKLQTESFPTFFLRFLVEKNIIRNTTICLNFLITCF